VSILPAMLVVIAPSKQAIRAPILPGRAPIARAKVFRKNDKQKTRHRRRIAANAPARQAEVAVDIARHVDGHCPRAEVRRECPILSVASPVALAIAAATGALICGRGFHRRIARLDSIGFGSFAMRFGRGDGRGGGVGRNPAAAALLDKARHDIVRYQQALPSGSVSKQVLQNAEDQKASLEADLKEAKAELQVANANAKAGEIIEENLAPKAEPDELACPSEK
jgi:hypothetical protein